MNTRKYSKVQEQSVKKAIGAKLVPNSGAGLFVKGDLQDCDTLYECKTTTSLKTSYSVKKDVLEKAKLNAFANNKLYAVLVFNFGPNTDNYYVLSEKHYKQLVQDKR